MDNDYYEKNHVIEYSEFHGSPTDDAELFLRDFEAIAQYNEQSTDEEKLRKFSGSLKFRALVWYKSLRAEDTEDWSTLRASFLKQFRRNPHKLLTKLSRIKKKPEETIRKYSFRVTKLINKLEIVDDEPYPERVKVWWYLNGLPTSVRKYCLQADYASLESAVSTAKIYDSTALAPCEELRVRPSQQQVVDDADLHSDGSDVESCTSVGTFISSVVESGDLKGRKIIPIEVSSSPGLSNEVKSPWNRNMGACSDRPRIGVTRSEQKLTKKTVSVGDFKHGKKPPR